jgi:predicted Zn-ribbon and HTH transcriptional regulator
MIIVFLVLFAVFFVILLPIGIVNQRKRESAAQSASCPKCGHDAKVYADNTGACPTCRAKLIRSANGGLIVK